MRFAVAPVHPRACGEHSANASPSLFNSGPSPRLRGTRKRHSHQNLHGRSIPAPAGNTRQGQNEKGCVRSIPAPAGNTGSWPTPSPCRSVHPRACGEHVRLSNKEQDATGPSPRLRGTPDDPGPGLAGPRSIPAPAGNTWSALARGYTPPVHPRACGEHRERERGPMTPAGPSPRLRGTRLLPGKLRLQVRSIPAPAGNTFRRRSRAGTGAVHPRACGEHDIVIQGSTVAAGPSPRLRGTRDLEAQVLAGERSIPAPAGNTDHSRVRQEEGTVHPRACGEHRNFPSARSRHVGPSPRLRGTREIVKHCPIRIRSIPAPAGNTRRASGTGCAQPVHPRACGEHLIPDDKIKGWIGPSPRLRGTPACASGSPAARRSIPAPAGNTRRAGTVVAGCAVHPRACGEHARLMARWSDSDGPSPRLRGTQYLVRPFWLWARSIPAPAGNTMSKFS